MSVPDEAYAAALAELPSMTSRRLSRLVGSRPAEEAWVIVTAGRASELIAGSGAVRRRDRAEQVPLGALHDSAASKGSRRRSPAELARLWQAVAKEKRVHDIWSRYRALGVRVHVLGRAGYPAALGSDPEAPPVLFTLGRESWLESRRVAIVGTRSATHYGQDVASELGLGLAGAGVAVVSGLARGIDKAAHDGALAGAGAGPVGVAASGLDVPYPASSWRTWKRVGETGLLLGESPLGCQPEAWRFPMRNRLIAAISEIVVVVEAHRQGGAFSTVEAASQRGVQVMAVPGSVHSPASAGANELLVEGVAPVRDLHDVLVALGLRAGGQSSAGGGSAGVGGAGGSGMPGPPREAAASSIIEREPAGELERRVLGSVDWTPTTTGAVVARCGLGLGDVAMALAELEQEGWITRAGGSWQRERASGASRALRG